MTFDTTEDPSHPLLGDFVALNDPAQRRVVERSGNYFVVEGALALERLLDLPQWQIRAIALSPKAAERFTERLAPHAHRVVVAAPAVLQQVVGFDIHRGILASVQRRAVPPATSLIQPTKPSLNVALEGVNDHENLGAIYRNCAALGASSVLLDPTCADPFYRRSIRVSLGHVMAVPTGALGPIPQGIAELTRLEAQTVALVTKGGASLQATASRLDRSRPVVLLAGAEGPGLSEQACQSAEYLATIEMAGAVDSLNVATALAIALHGLNYPNDSSGA